MCYDAESLLKRILKDAIHQGVPQEEIDELKRKLSEYDLEKTVRQENLIDDVTDYYHVNAWDHPKMIIMVDDKPSYEAAEWGFVHGSTKTIQKSYTSFDKPWVNNPIAQSETVFEKPTFKEAALNRRCVISLDSFYEHQHVKGKTFPYRIMHKDGLPLSVAGIYNENELVDEESGEVIHKKTFAILTCAANKMMAEIHNNPAVLKRSGPRMPVILDAQGVETYLAKTTDNTVGNDYFDELQNVLFKPAEEELLTCHTVRNLKDRRNMPYLGNVPEIRDPFVWPELSTQELF